MGVTHAVKRSAFTLIEILVVIAIIAVIASLVFPVVAGAKRRAKQASCITNERQVFVAYSLYSADHGGEIGGAPETLLPLVGYSRSPEVFQCPGESSITRRADGMYNAVLLDIRGELPGSPTRISYAYARDYDPASKPSVWAKVAAGSTMGIVSCPWHGGVSGNAVRSPALGYLLGREGPFLRVCGDGHLLVWPRALNPQYLTTWDLFYAPLRAKDVLGDEQ